MSYSDFVFQTNTLSSTPSSHSEVLSSIDDIEEDSTPPPPLPIKIRKKDSSPATVTLRPSSQELHPVETELADNSDLNESNG